MDPETAVDMLKDLVREAESYLRSPYYRGKTSNSRATRMVLDEALEVQDNLIQWVNSGGFRPRRLDTWMKRFDVAEAEYMERQYEARDRTFRPDF